VNSTRIATQSIAKNRNSILRVEINGRNATIADQLSGIPHSDAALDRSWGNIGSKPTPLGFVPKSPFSSNSTNSSPDGRPEEQLHLYIPPEDEISGNTINPTENLYITQEPVCTDWSAAMHNPSDATFSFAQISEDAELWNSLYEPLNNCHSTTTSPNNSIDPNNNW
jgi:hypothetical protein